MSRLLAVLCVAAISCVNPPDDVAIALEAARSGLATPEGWEYSRVFGELATPAFRAALNSCFREIRHPSRRPVSFLYRLDGSGSLVESIHYPSTNLSDCIAARFQDFPDLPPPPNPDYWVLMALGSGYTRTPQPSYPSQPAAGGREGYAVVAYTISSEGKTKNVVVVESTEDAFGEASVEAVSRWEYHPDPDAGPIIESGRKTYFLFCLPSSRAERPRFEACRGPRNRARFVRDLRERLDF